MPDKKPNKPLKAFFYEEQKKIVGSCTAFSIATILLYIQGSISAPSSVSLLGLILVSASIPGGVFSYIVAMKIQETGHVPESVSEMGDQIISVPISMSMVGFLMLLASKNLLLFGVVIVSAIISAIYFNRIAKLWPESDKDEKANDGCTAPKANGGQSEE